MLHVGYYETSPTPRTLHAMIMICSRIPLKDSVGLSAEPSKTLNSIEKVCRVQQHTAPTGVASLIWRVLGSGFRGLGLQV